MITTNKPTTSLLYRPDALPVAQPTLSKHWRENITFHGLAYPSSPGGLPTLSVTTNSSWLPWGELPPTNNSIWQKWKSVQVSSYNINLASALSYFAQVLNETRVAISCTVPTECQEWCYAGRSWDCWNVTQWRPAVVGYWTARVPTQGTRRQDWSSCGPSVHRLLGWMTDQPSPNSAQDDIYGNYVLSLSVLMAIFPGGWGLVGTRMYPFGISLQLRMTKVVVATTGAIRRATLQSKRHHQQTNTQLFTHRMPFLLPNSQFQSTKRTTTYKKMMHRLYETINNAQIICSYALSVHYLSYHIIWSSYPPYQYN